MTLILTKSPGAQLLAPPPPSVTEPFMDPPRTCTTAALQFFSIVIVAMLALAGASEGDAARLLNQTAEHLNQLARLSETHQQLAFNRYP